MTHWTEQGIDPTAFPHVRLLPAAAVVRRANPIKSGLGPFWGWGGVRVAAGQKTANFRAAKIIPPTDHAIPRKTIGNPMTEADEILSVRALARRVNRSHSSVVEWTHRDDWPFSRVPPWPASLLPEVRRWADATLKGGHDVRRESREPDVPSALLLLEAFPELYDPQYRRELDRYVTRPNAPIPDADAARARITADLHRRADEYERRLAR